MRKQHSRLSTGGKELSFNFFVTASIPNSPASYSSLLTVLPVLLCASIRRASTPLVSYLPPYQSTFNYNFSNTFTTTLKDRAEHCVHPTEPLFQRPSTLQVYWATIYHTYIHNPSHLPRSTPCLHHEPAARATTAEAAQPKAQPGKTSSMVRSTPGLCAE